ncbi:MAG TPA: glycosyltransferase family 1 protein [Deltaproteobacteria bacterium]|nr:glycosyltransferase family 1 protein [Deltaproteobacteria bacterium]
MSRIVHVCRTGWPAVGGLEASVSGLARAQAASGHQVEVVTLDRDAAGVRLHPCTDEGIVYRRLRRVGPRRYPVARGLIGAVCGAELIHVHGLDGLADVLVGVRRRHGVPVGISTHGGYFHTPRHRRLKQLWLRTVTRHTLSRADALWFTSATDRDTLSVALGRLPPEQRILPDGVDVEAFAAVRRRPEAGRWLVPGRIDVHKGLGDLIRALGHLAREDQRPFLVEITGRERVVGLQRRLQRLARGLGLGVAVRFVGQLDRAAMIAALGRAELVLLPSRYEGFGIAAVEAMAAQVPIVVSEAPALRAHVEDGVTGFVAPFTDPVAAAEVIAGVRGRDHRALARRGAVAAQRHSWSARAAEVAAAYRALGVG